MVRNSTSTLKCQITQIDDIKYNQTHYFSFMKIKAFHPVESIIAEMKVLEALKTSTRTKKTNYPENELLTGSMRVSTRAILLIITMPLSLDASVTNPTGLGLMHRGNE